VLLRGTERAEASDGASQARPSNRSTRFLSPPVTSAGRARRRVRLVGFFSSRWARNAFRRMIFPVPVTLNRLAAPRWVFIFGITLLRCCQVVRAPEAPQPGVRDLSVPGWWAPGLLLRASVATREPAHRTWPCGRP